jgi:hypothetical protein
MYACIFAFLCVAHGMCLVPQAVHDTEQVAATQHAQLSLDGAAVETVTCRFRCKASCLSLLKRTLAIALGTSQPAAPCLPQRYDSANCLCTQEDNTSPDSALPQACTIILLSTASTPPHL